MDGTEAMDGLLLILQQGGVPPPVKIISVGGELPGVLLRFQDNATMDYALATTSAWLTASTVPVRFQCFCFQNETAHTF